MSNSKKWISNELGYIKNRKGIYVSIIQLSSKFYELFDKI
jgi:hypothetical protein